MVVVRIIEIVGFEARVSYAGKQYWVSLTDLSGAFIRDGATYSYIDPRNLNNEIKD